MSRSGPSRWSLPALLAALDREVVPLLQWLARASAWLLTWPFRTLTRAELRTRPGRALHRHGGLVLLAAATIGFLGSAVHLQRYPELRGTDGAGEERALPGEDGAPAAGSELPGEEGPVEVGPVIGAAIGDHASRRTAVLAELPGDEERLAVVSFREYRSPRAAVDALPAAADVLGVQYRLPAAGERPQRLDATRTEVVTAVAAAVEEARAEFASEEDEVRRLLDSGTVEDEDFREDLELRLSELETVRNLLATDAPVVFALVVRAPVADLRALSEHDAVRLVDVAGADADSAAIVFYGVLPEDGDRATFGRQG